MSILLTPAEIDEIATLLEREYGLEFPLERRRALDRAVGLRLRPPVASYLAKVRSDRKELAALAELASNNLTKFFRNGAQLEALAAHLHANPETALRAWVTGCSTGEEAFSLAMACEMTRLGYCDIIATDLSRGTLATARTARYSRRRVAAVPADAKERFFRLSGREYVVAPDIRERVRFMEHNVLDAPPETGFDIVTCRNVLTYLSERARATAVTNLRDAIAVGGFLLIGNAETLPDPTGFQPVQAAGATLYRRQ